MKISFSLLPSLSLITLGLVCASPALGQDLETVIQTGHSSDIRAVCYSPDGRLLVTASKDNSAKLWSEATGQEIRTFAGHTAGVNAAAFSPDGRFLATGSDDLTARIWEIETGKVIRSLRMPDDSHTSAAVTAVCFTPAGDYLLTGIRGLQEENSIILWETATGRQVRVFNGTFRAKQGNVTTSIVHSINALDLSADGQFFVSGSEDGTAKLWSLANPQALRTFGERKTFTQLLTDLRGVCAVGFSPDGKTIATGNDAGVVKIWDTTTGAEVRQMLGHKSSVLAIDFSPEGKWLATGGKDKSAKLWQAETGKEVRACNGHTGAVYAVSFKPDAACLVTGSDDQTAKVWNVATGTELLTLKGNAGRLVCASMSPEGKWLAVSSFDENASLAHLWDLTTGRKMRSLAGHTSVIQAITFSPDGGLLATGSADNTAKLWEVATGQELRTLRGHAMPKSSSTFDAGKIIAAKVNDYTKATAGFHYTTHLIGVTTVKFSPDGKYLATGAADETAKIWEVETGQEIRAISKQGEIVHAVCFSPDGKFLLVGSGDRPRLWDAVQGKKIRDFGASFFKIGSNAHLDQVESVCFNADGKYMLSGSRDHSVKLWETSTGKIVGYLDGHANRVTAVAFSPDGKYIVSGSWDNTAILWNAQPDSKKRGQVIRTFYGHSDRVLAVQVSADGKYVMTASADATTRLWDLASGKQLVTLVTLGAHDWAVATPDGHFDASAGAKRAIHFVKGNEVIELEQFFEDFYTPNLLALVTSSGEIGTRGVTAGNEFDKSPPPTVKITSPRPGETFSQSQIEIKIEATDAGGGIEEVKLLHNGKRVAAGTRGVKPVSTGSIHTFMVTLVGGQNTFVASAFSKGRIESRGYQLEILFQGASKTAVSYLLAVGINKYKNLALDLNYARADAEEFVTLVSQKSQKLFQKVEISTLYDLNATKAKLLAALDRIASKARPEDVFTFFYAGHGTLVDDQFYFVTSENVRLQDPALLKRDALWVEDLRNKLQGVKALKQVVVMDACQTGAATQQLAKRGAAEEKALAQLARSAGVHVLASAGSEQFASEFPQLGHGVFTYVLLEGLKGKADGAPNDGKITIYEIKSFLDDQVPLTAEKYKGGAQYPNTFSRGQDFPITLP